MYTPTLTDEEKELINQLKALPKDRFQKCFMILEREHFFHNVEDDNERVKTSIDLDEELWLEQGRIKAEYYAKMSIATATLQLDEAKEELKKIYQNWDKLQHDSPIYWNNIKTKHGWKRSLVGDVARDYNKEKTHYTFPDGEVVTR